MKIGNIEGTREEIKGFIEDHGLNAADLLQLPAPEKHISNMWVMVTCGLFVLSSIALHINGNSNIAYIPILIVTIVIGVWGIVVIHLKYKNWAVTSICILSMFGIVAVCSRIWGVKELLEFFRDQASKK